MNMSCMSKPAYRKHVEAIMEASEAEADEEMKKGRKQDQRPNF